MRIVSGDLGGRQIQAPASFTVRPTTDIAKESLFNILNNIYDFEDVSVLDFFAGIGSISLEFASRGSKKIVAVERAFKHADFIKKTAEKFNLDSIRVVKTDMRDFLKIHNEEYDIIFTDPPYDLDWIEKVPELIMDSKVFSENSLLIVEHPGSVDYSSVENYSKTRKYGKVHFSFFERSNS